MKTGFSQESRTGIGLILGATFLISCSDTVSKLMTAQVPIMQIALVQSVIMMLSVPLLVRSLDFGSIVKTARPGLQLVRSVCQLTSAMLFFSGLKLLPLADIVALIFVGPFIITLLAALVLKERVGLARWCACVVGFAGALVVIRPGFGNIGWAALFPLGATSVYAVYAICTRKLAPQERTGTMMFYSALVSVLVLSLSSPFYWVSPVPTGWIALLSIGVLSCGSAALVIAAHARAPASLLAPFAYVEIITATVFGYLVFTDVPDVFTILGAGIVIGSGLYVYRYESRGAESPSPET